MQISSGMTNVESGDQSILEIRNHLMDLYTRVGVGLLKRHAGLIELLVNADSEWQETCDQLIDEMQQAKESKEQIEQDLSRKHQV